jgi:hypothetical protein
MGGPTCLLLFVAALSFSAGVHAQEERPTDMCAGCHYDCNCNSDDTGDATCQDCHHTCDGMAFCSDEPDTDSSGPSTWDATWIACPAWAAYVDAECGVDGCAREMTGAEVEAACAEFRDPNGCGSDQNAIDQWTTMCAGEHAHDEAICDPTAASACQNESSDDTGITEACYAATYQYAPDFAECLACDPPVTSGATVCAECEAAVGAALGSCSDSSGEAPTCNFAALMVRASTPPIPTRILPPAAAAG